MEPIMQLVNAMTAMTTAMQKLTEKMTSEYINTFEEIGTSSETPKQTEEPVQEEKPFGSQSEACRTDTTWFF